jgi:epoxyqueuosine reductase
MMVRPRAPKHVSQDLKLQLIAEARAIGFDGIGFAHPDALGEASARLRTFVALGRHGDMDWMERHLERRADPRTLMSDVRTVIMLAMSYAPTEDPLQALSQRTRGVVSAYAKGRDYHDIIKAKLKTLARGLQARTGADVKVFVDTAPLMEKPLAAAAGLGWQGKHTNLVSRAEGSWLLLGAILTSAEMAADIPETDHCGTCRRCLDICPTAAFPAPYVLDARRCIAYLTIEHKGHIDPQFRVAMGNRVFGCDDCLAVCPWNKFAAASREIGFAARAGADNPSLAELLALDDPTFRSRFAGTPVKRTGRDRLLRNALIAVGNSADPSLIDAVRALIADPSPLVRAMAIWALRRLVPEFEIAPLRARKLAVEADADVRSEWTREHPK